MNQSCLDVGIKIIASDISYELSEEELKIIASASCQPDNAFDDMLAQHEISNGY